MKTLKNFISSDKFQSVFIPAFRAANFIGLFWLLSEVRYGDHSPFLGAIAVIWSLAIFGWVFKAELRLAISKEEKNGVAQPRKCGATRINP